MIDSAVLKEFKTISLEEMGKVRLMNRTDTKYVTEIDRVNSLLKLAAQADYMIQEIDGALNMPYYTRYYDTEDTRMFYQHQRGKKNRQKVRIRKYEDSETPPFIEVKTKNNKGRTRKDRMAMESGENELEPYYEFLDLHALYEPSTLEPQIENHFYRITLVNAEMTERVTIDTRLEFNNFRTGKRIALDNLGIIEWKRDGRSSRSPLGSILKQLRIHEGGFSKYCIGMAVTNPELRQNRLKEKLRIINKISPL